MKYEINRISKSSEDYLIVTKDGDYRTHFQIQIRKNDRNYRTFEEAFEQAQKWIKEDLETPTKTTVYTYEA